MPPRIRRKDKVHGQADEACELELQHQLGCASPLVYDLKDQRDSERDNCGYSEDGYCPPR
jgi:hypothetical protein